MSDRTCSVEGCNRPREKRGWCAMHYARWHRRGSVDVTLLSWDNRSRISDHWQDYVSQDPYTGCWNWTGARMGNGYGAIWVGGGRRTGTHRFVWELIRGPIPDGLQIDHLCRNILCCNPDHLEPVTHAENMARTVGFNRPTECKRGHAFTPENTAAVPKGRRCRACARHRYHTRKKAASLT